MAKPDRIEIIVSGREARCIHSDEIMPILEKIGSTEIRRASHVEPGYDLSDKAVSWLFTDGAFKDRELSLDTERRMLMLPTKDHAHELRKLLPHGKWYADLLMNNGPVLGPFDEKQVALDAEVQWLREHNFPFCQTGKC